LERMDLEESRNRLNQSVAYYSFESPPNVAKVRQFPSILCSIPYPNVAKDLLLRRATNSRGQPFAESRCRLVNRLDLIVRQCAVKSCSFS